LMNLRCREMGIRRSTRHFMRCSSIFSRSYPKLMKIALKLRNKWLSKRRVSQSKLSLCRLTFSTTRSNFWLPLTTTRASSRIRSRWLKTIGFKWSYCKIDCTSLLRNRKIRVMNLTTIFNLPWLALRKRKMSTKIITKT
jgi:hypothetical protein